jgi:hypothetical protein
LVSAPDTTGASPREQKFFGFFLKKELLAWGLASLPRTAELARAYPLC